VATSTKPVGRIDFVLRMLVATALAVEWNRVLPLTDLLNPSLHLHRGESGLEVLLHIACYPFVAILILSTTSGRLLDAKLPLMFFIPITLLWAFSTMSLMFVTHYWRMGLVANVLLLIAGGSLRIKPAPVRIGFGDTSAEASSDKDTSDDKVKRRQFNPGSPRAFVIILIILASLWLPLIYLDDISGHGAGVWVARIGYAILGFFWFSLSVNRFKDAGLLDGRFFPYMIAIATISLLPLKLNLINGYEALVIFVLIQTPIALLKSKPRPEDPLTETEENEKCLRDPLGGILVRSKDQDDMAYTEPKPPVFTGISSGSAKRVPSWRRF
jgi:hypothetical protein